MKLPDKTYDVLKYLAIICLPALEKFIPSVFNTWGIPYGEPIAKTINDIAILIGALICVSVISYNKTKSVEDYNTGDKENG